jgi:prolyl oligopeptidase
MSRRRHTHWLFATLVLGASLAGAASCTRHGPLSPTPNLEPDPNIAAPSAKPAPKPKLVKPGPPLAERIEVEDTLHGVKLVDPYRWLEDGDSDKTKAWLNAFDRYTRSVLDGLPGRAALAKRLTELAYLEWVSPPRRRGTRYFFSRRHKDKEKVVWYWREGKSGDAKVLLDPNTMSSDGSVALRGVSPSYDGKWVAYKLSKNAADHATMYLMDVASGKVSEVDTIDGARYAYASWEPKGSGFYYTRLPTDPTIPVAELPGHAAVYFHKLGSDPKTDPLIEAKTGDPKVFQQVTVSRDGHYLLHTKYFGWSRNEVRFRDLRRHKEWQPLALGHEAKFQVYAWKDQFYVHTNHQAPRWRVMKVDPRKPALDEWIEVVPQHEKAVLDDMSVVGNHLALRYLENAASSLRITKLDGEALRTIALPGIGSVDGPSGNPEDDEAYYAFNSFTTPRTVFETSVKDGGRTPYFELDVPVDPTPYGVEQVWYTSKDGTRVSMFIVRRKGAPKDGSSPMLLAGYGGFSVNMTPRFSATRFAWLERGGSWAVPNLRGGAEYGEEWHKAGTRERKQNVFDDFIGAAEFLVREGYTKPERLAIAGGSNGGLLVGAAMTQRPELFGAVICRVPLLDMVRYPRFGSGKTWISEYGSADDPKLFPALLAYSPYHRLQLGTRYPALLMETADSDDRVDPMHARKFTARLRHNMGNGANVLLRVETKAGHGGGDMMKKTVARLTDEYVFLMSEFGLTKATTAKPPAKPAPKPASGPSSI